MGFVWDCIIYCIQRPRVGHVTATKGKHEMNQGMADVSIRLKFSWWSAVIGVGFPGTLWFLRYLELRVKDVGSTVTLWFHVFNPTSSISSGKFGGLEKMSNKTNPPFFSNQVFFHHLGFPVFPPTPPRTPRTLGDSEDFRDFSEKMSWSKLRLDEDSTRKSKHPNQPNLNH